MRLTTALLSLCLCAGALTLGYPIDSHADTPTRFIIKWKDAAPRSRSEALIQANDTLRQRVGYTLQQRRMLDNQLQVLQADTAMSSQSRAATLQQLGSDPRVEYIVEDKRRYAHALTNDPLITANNAGHPNGQWYLNNQQTAAVNAINAWDVSQGGSAGSGVIVAVLDTGIRLNHPDFAGKLLPGFDFVDCDQTNCTGAGQTFLTANDNSGWDTDPSDPGDWISNDDIQGTFFSHCTEGDSSWHGTRVAGIIGAATNNGLGIAAIGYHARILPVRVLGKCGGYDSDIIAGMKWAAGLSVAGATPTINPNPAKIINLSLGSADTCSPAYQDAVNQVRAAGVSVVASAGNEAGPLDTPANCSGVISVVGVRNAGSKVGFSSVGSGATIAAPAGNCVNDTSLGLPCFYSIDTTTNLGATTPTLNDYTDAFNFNLGTSFSAPIVSGTIALMLGSNTTLTPNAIRARLQASAKAFPALTGVAACHIPLSMNDVQDSECNCSRAMCGAGLTDTHAAVLSATESITPYIRGATSATSNRAVVLDAAGSTLTDNTATYSWSIQSGSASLSSTVGTAITVTTPATAGSITLLLQIDDGNGHTDNLTHTINVYDPPTASITGNNTVTAGGSLNLNGSGSSAPDGGPLNYVWSVIGGSATLSTAQSASTTLTASSTSGSITVRLTVTDQLGGSDIETLNITVQAIPDSGGGGGGALSAASIAALLGLAMLRRRSATGFAPHRPDTP